MDIAAEKDRLKKEIDKITDPSVLMQISQLLYHDNSSLMTEEQIVIVMEERAKYINDPSSLIPLEDFKANIKKKYGF
nr:hypothetical protein [uncultured Flavobacterium sp.]